MSTHTKVTCVASSGEFLSSPVLPSFLPSRSGGDSLKVVVVVSPSALRLSTYALHNLQSTSVRCGTFSITICRK